MNTIPIRTLVAAIVAAALAAAGTACTAASAAPPPQVTMLADVTGSIADSPAYRGQVEQALATVLAAVADRRGTVTVVAVKSAGDRPVELLPRTDLSLDGVDKKAAEQARPVLAKKLVADTMHAYDTAVAAAGSGSSLVRVLNAAIDTSTVSHLLVVGDGIEWDQGAKVPMDADADVAAAVDGYRNDGLLPDLAGVPVVHLSAGEADGVSQAQAATVRRFWEAFYAAAGAAPVTVTGAVDASGLLD